MDFNRRIGSLATVLLSAVVGSSAGTHSNLQASESSTLVQAQAARYSGNIIEISYLN